jgi:hypothetical protein
LYQSPPSVQRSTGPKLVFAVELREPVAYTSASEAAAPSTAL